MSKHLELLEARRTNLVTERDSILETAPADFTPEVQARFDAAQAEVDALDLRIADQKERDAAEQRAAKVTPTVQVGNEPNPVYRKDGNASYFRDLFFAGQPASAESVQARENLIKSQESRALSTSATAGGTFAPPLWLVEDYVAYARAARVTADLMQHDVLPGGVSSINLPAITGGTAVGVVQTQNTAVQNTDIVTTSISSGITTIAGQQVVALQMLRQSGIPFDRVILSDLALAYASQVNVQVISGSGANGQLAGLITSGTTVTFTSTVPAFVSTTAANSFYNKVVNGIAKVGTTRFLPADAIVMSPTRWGWVLEALDGNSRPLVTPNGNQYNSPAITGDVVAQGPAGTMGGLPVYVDPLIPANLGVATNQDVVMVLRRGDNWLYETAVEQTTWEATYANQNSVLFRALGFSAFVPRYAGSIQVINGTGLVVPTL